MRNPNSSIGGYFDLEISNRGSIYHDSALAVNTGRNAFEHILLCKQVKHIYIPFYTCDVLLQPLLKHQIEYTYYHIREDFFPLLPDLKTSDYVLFTNYFGLTGHHIEVLRQKTDNLIIDNAQAFYDYPVDNKPTLYSPRKFFGVPDGGFVYNANELSADMYPQDLSIERVGHLLARIETSAEYGYSLFKENDEKLDHQPIKLMSKLTRHLLSGIDYERTKQQRLENFHFLHNHLKSTNKHNSLIKHASIICPMVYPYWIEDASSLKQKLTESQIYTAQYWPNVLNWKDTLEYDLTQNQLCLPIDQRYTPKDLQNILSEIL